MSKQATTTVSSGGVSALGLLGVLFVALKLLGVTEVATWSWLWVLAPFWIGLAIALGVLAVVMVGALLLAALLAVIGWFEARR